MTKTCTDKNQVINFFKKMTYTCSRVVRLYIELSSSSFVEATNNSGTHFTRAGELLLRTWTVLGHSSHRWRKRRRWLQRVREKDRESDREGEWDSMVHYSVRIKNKNFNGRSFPFNFSLSRFSLLRCHENYCYLFNYFL